MITFTIENETNNITAHASREDAATIENALSFQEQRQLATLAADWPAARLIDIWNSLPGVTPVKKFTNRGIAVQRIWSAIQVLGETTPSATSPDTAPATSPAAAEEAPASEETTREEDAPETPKAARHGSKTEVVLALLHREGGATAQELMDATGWQAHSVRGFLSGTIRKKLNLALLSFKAEDGSHRYSLGA